MADMHLNCQVLDSTGRRSYRKVWFTDNTLTASKHQYTIERFLVQGNNGTIFIVRDSDGNRLAAKFLHILAEIPLRRFEYESMVLSGMDHVNILPCYDAGNVETTFEEPIPFMITGLYDTNLDYVVGQGGALPLGKVKLFGSQMCDGFAYAHAQGVIHRDVKPANFFLSGETIVIGDYGLAKTHNEVGQERFYRENLTMSGEFVGPILWMSPELVRYISDKNYPVDHRSDLFQVGMVVWYMATKQIVRGIPDVDDDPTGGKLHAFVTKAIQTKVEKRYQSAQEMKQALQSL